ncbi:hypothetical protein [Treponema primitia]|uniref:hypothetical protein n=1 Tax=Treponema primitia TaxID=88058 RepID=UPI0002D5C020|nr:hypothetical protein [Treponema primitia]
MGSYYYLAAQLPNLVYGQSAPMTSAYFRELAKSLLDAEDGALLDVVSLDPELPGKNAAGDGRPSYAENASASGSEFIDHWREWERTLRLNVARYRAQRTKRDTAAPVEPPIYPADAVAAAVKAAVAVESPLEAEMVLDKARWEAIGYLQGLDNFSRNVAYAYLLKLLILERRASFKTEEGFKEYKTLYAAILSSAQSSVLGPVGPSVGEPK